MSWEIAVQVWVYAIVGFVVGVLLTFLIFVLPLRRKLRRQAQQQPAPRQAGTGAASATATAEPVPAAEPEAARAREPAHAGDPAPAPFAPAQQDAAATARPVPPESPEEQTVVFDFGGPDSRSQTRHFEDDSDVEPWRPTVDIASDDRLSDQLPRRTRQPVEPPPADRTGEPGMFDASMPVPDMEAPPAQPPQTPIEQRLSGGPVPEVPSWQRPPGEPQVQDLPEEPPAEQATAAGPEEEPDEENFQFLPGPDEHPPHPEGREASSVNQETAYPVYDADAGAAADPAGPGDGARHAATGALFEPAAEGTEPEHEVPAGPFGPGSALPRPDGSAPSDEFAVKARTSSMVFHTRQSPFFDRLLPQVWFRTEEEANRAGFTSWDRPVTE